MIATKASRPDAEGGFAASAIPLRSLRETSYFFSATPREQIHPAASPDITPKEIANGLVAGAGVPDATGLAGKSSDANGRAADFAED